MDREKAKRILLAYDPVRNDPALGYFDEALALAETDPVLRDWLDQHLEEDAKIRGALETIQAPSGLRSAILAAFEAESQADAKGVAKPKERKILGFPTAYPSNAPLRIAAAIALFLGALFTFNFLGDNQSPTHSSAWNEGPYTASAFPVAMVKFLETRGPKLDFAAGEYQQLTNYLKRHDAPIGIPPKGLLALETMGCERLRFGPNPVTLTCFKHNGDVVHFFTIRRDAFPTVADNPTALRFQVVGSTECAHWSDGEHVYVACAVSPEAPTLETLLAGAN